MKNFGSILVGKGHIFKGNVPVHRGAHGIRFVLLHGGIHNVKHTVDGHTSLAQLRDHSAQLTDGPHQHGVVGNEGDVLALQQRALDAEYCAEDHHQHNLDAGEQVRRAPESAEDLCHLHPEGGVVVVLPLEFINLDPLQTKGTDNPHTGEVLLGHCRELALVFVAFLPALVDAAVEIHRVEDHRRHRDQCQ